MTRSRLLRTSLAAALAWAIVVAMMWAAADPARYDPTARHYGMDWPGDLERLAITAGAEVLALWLLLRPWKPGSLAPRLLLAAALLTPYAALRLIAGLHAGPTAAAHDLWLIGVWIALLAAAVLVAWRGRYPMHPTPAPATRPPMDFAAPLRARYPDAHRCTCTVEGRPCAPEQIVIRTMNFGQHWRTEGIQDVAYRVELPRAYVADVLREYVPGYVEDSRIHPDPSDALDRALHAAGYPDADGVLANPALRDEFIGLFRYEILGGWFGAGDPDREPGYVLNTLDRIEVDDDRVTFTGTGRRSGIPVRYQDV